MTGQGCDGAAGAPVPEFGSPRTIQRPPPNAAAVPRDWPRRRIVRTEVIGPISSSMTQHVDDVLEVFVAGQVAWVVSEAKMDRVVTTGHRSAVRNAAGPGQRSAH